MMNIFPAIRPQTTPNSQPISTGSPGQQATGDGFEAALGAADQSATTAPAGEDTAQFSGAAVTQIGPRTGTPRQRDPQSPGATGRVDGDVPAELRERPEIDLRSLLRELSSAREELQVQFAEVERSEQPQEFVVRTDAGTLTLPGDIANDENPVLDPPGPVSSETPIAEPRVPVAVPQSPANDLGGLAVGQIADLGAGFPGASQASPPAPTPLPEPVPAPLPVPPPPQAAPGPTTAQGGAAAGMPRFDSMGSVSAGLDLPGASTGSPPAPPVTELPTPNYEIPEGLGEPSRGDIFFKTPQSGHQAADGKMPIDAQSQNERMERLAQRLDEQGREALWSVRRVVDASSSQRAASIDPELANERLQALLERITETPANSATASHAQRVAQQANPAQVANPVQVAQSRSAEAAPELEYAQVEEARQATVATTDGSASHDGRSSNEGPRSDVNPGKSPEIIERVSQRSAQFENMLDAARVGSQDAAEGNTVRAAAAASARGASAPTPSQAAVIEQVASRLAELAPGRTLSLALDPHQLGQVMLKFVRRGQEWDLRIIAETPEAAQALAKDLPRLEQSIARSGETVKVEVALGEADTSAGGQQSSETQTSQQGESEQFLGWSTPAGSELPEEQVAAAGSIQSDAILDVVT